MAAWASDLDVANGILPGYIMMLYFFTGYALRLQVSFGSSPDRTVLPQSSARVMLLQSGAMAPDRIMSGHIAHLWQIHQADQIISPR